MIGRRIATWTVSIFLSVTTYAANPFLNAPDDKPISAKFRGTEWGDDIGQQEIPLTAQSSDNASGKNVVGRDFQNRIHGSENRVLKSSAKFGLTILS